MRLDERFETLGLKARLTSIEYWALTVKRLALSNICIQMDSRQE